MKDLTKLKSPEDLRGLKVEDLQKELDEAQKELSIVKMGLELNTERQSHKPGILKKYVARIKTVANEQQITLK
ncbi:MAG: 50S ribosomal protein L29 [Candidatus Gracilibacteria bacterium]|jgi:ribosomal protein L29|nr:50S ribosomal protein L29 [Candidatus Gracilibacteria bacterium]